VHHEHPFSIGDNSRPDEVYKEAEPFSPAAENPSNPGGQQAVMQVYPVVIGISGSLC
jgi:hypothetical protein